MQVRSAHRLSDHGLTQKLPIAGTSVLTACQSSGNIFVAATGSDGIHQLAPVPFGEQARALSDMGHFAEALTMMAFLDDTQVLMRSKASVCTERARLHVLDHTFMAKQFLHVAELSTQLEAVAQVTQCSTMSIVAS